MSNYKESWLPHLKHSIPKEAFGYSTSMYSIALEGWRRGLTLRFINRDHNKVQTEFILSNKKKRYRFSGSRGNVISKEAINICSDKDLTKKVLNKNKIRVVKGEKFHKNISNEEIVEYVENFGYPVVLKPYNGVGGEGVIIDIQDELTLREALIHVRKELNHPTVLIEQYITGNDYQLYVVGDKVVAAFERIPASITGDGQKSINQLINNKNKVRLKNPGLSNYLIDKKDTTLQELLHKQNYELEDIPPKDTKINLSLKSNIAAGGETIDRTEELPSEILNLAIDAAKTIHNLPICAVELIVDKKNEKGYIFEVKTQAVISGYLFPVEGQARDVPKEIIDYFFPETSGLERDTLHYFDFEAVYDSFSKNFFQDFTVPKIDKGNKESKRFIVKGLKNRNDYINDVRPKLLDLGLNGFIKYRSKDRLEIVIAGPIKSFEIIETNLIAHERLQKEEFKITEKTWSKPVKIGLEIINLKDNSERKTKLKKRIQSKKLDYKSQDRNNEKSSEGVFDTLKNFIFTNKT